MPGQRGRLEKVYGEEALSIQNGAQQRDSAPGSGLQEAEGGVHERTRKPGSDDGGRGVYAAAPPQHLQEHASFSSAPFRCETDPRPAGVSSLQEAMREPGALQAETTHTPEAVVKVSKVQELLSRAFLELAQQQQEQHSVFNATAEAPPLSCSPTALNDSITHETSAQSAKTGAPPLEPKVVAPQPGTASKVLASSRGTPVYRPDSDPIVLYCSDTTSRGQGPLQGRRGGLRQGPSYPVVVPSASRTPAYPHQSNFQEYRAVVPGILTTTGVGPNPSANTLRNVHSASFARSPNGPLAKTFASRSTDFWLNQQQQQHQLLLQQQHQRFSQSYSRLTLQQVEEQQSYLQQLLQQWRRLKDDSESAESQCGAEGGLSLSSTDPGAQLFGGSGRENEYVTAHVRRGMNAVSNDASEGPKLLNPLHGSPTRSNPLMVVSPTLTNNTGPHPQVVTNGISYSRPPQALETEPRASVRLAASDTRDQGDLMFSESGADRPAGERIVKGPESSSRAFVEDLLASSMTVSKGEYDQTSSGDLHDGVPRTVGPRSPNSNGAPLKPSRLTEPQAIAQQEQQLSLDILRNLLSNHAPHASGDGYQPSLPSSAASFQRHSLTAGGGVSFDKASGGAGPHCIVASEQVTEPNSLKTHEGWEYQQSTAQRAGLHGIAPPLHPSALLSHAHLQNCMFSSSELAPHQLPLEEQSRGVVESRLSRLMAAGQTGIPVGHPHLPRTHTLSPTKVLHSLYDGMDSRTYRTEFEDQQRHQLGQPSFPAPPVSPIPFHHQQRQHASQALNWLAQLQSSAPKLPLWDSGGDRAGGRRPPECHRKGGSVLAGGGTPGPSSYHHPSSAASNNNFYSYHGAGQQQQHRRKSGPQGTQRYGNGGPNTSSNHERFYKLSICLPITLPYGNLRVTKTSGENFYYFENEAQFSGARMLFSPEEGVCDAWASFLQIRAGQIYNVNAEQIPLLVALFHAVVRSPLCTKNILDTVVSRPSDGQESEQPSQRFMFDSPLVLRCKGLYKTEGQDQGMTAVAGTEGYTTHFWKPKSQAPGSSKPMVSPSDRFETRGYFQDPEVDRNKFNCIRERLQRFAQVVQLVFRTPVPSGPRHTVDSVAAANLTADPEILNTFMGIQAFLGMAKGSQNEDDTGECKLVGPSHTNSNTSATPFTYQNQRVPTVRLAAPFDKESRVTTDVSKSSDCDSQDVYFPIIIKEYGDVQNKHLQERLMSDTEFAEANVALGVQVSEIRLEHQSKKMVDPRFGQSLVLTRQMAGDENPQQWNESKRCGMSRTPLVDEGKTTESSSSSQLDLYTLLQKIGQQKRQSDDAQLDTVSISATVGSGNDDIAHDKLVDSASVVKDSCLSACSDLSEKGLSTDGGQIECDGDGRDLLRSSQNPSLAGVPFAEAENEERHSGSTSHLVASTTTTASTSNPSDSSCVRVEEVGAVVEGDAQEPVTPFTKYTSDQSTKQTHALQPATTVSFVSTNLPVRENSIESGSYGSSLRDLKIGRYCFAEHLDVPHVTVTYQDAKDCLSSSHGFIYARHLISQQQGQQTHQGNQYSLNAKSCRTTGKQYGTALPKSGAQNLVHTYQHPTSSLSNREHSTGTTTEQACIAEHEQLVQKA